MTEELQHAIQATIIVMVVILSGILLGLTAAHILLPDDAHPFLRAASGLCILGGIIVAAAGVLSAARTQD